MTEDQFKRLLDEQDQLFHRFNALEDFLKSSEFEKLSSLHQGLLIKQYDSMIQYYHILCLRIRLLSGRK